MNWPTLIDVLFQKAEPYLSVRGDTLHTRVAHERALVLLKHEGGDPRVVEPAIILHDVGWSAVDPKTIGAAFGVRADGNAAAALLNRIHEVEGAAIAGRILESLHYDRRLTDWIILIVERHDSGTAPETTEEKLVRDADRLWRFSKRGFWTEIERQGVDPARFHDRLIQRRKEWFATATALHMAEEDLFLRGRELGLRIPGPPPP